MFLNFVFKDLPEFLGAVSQEDLSVANIEEDTVKILVEDGQYVYTKSGNNKMYNYC